MSFFDAYADKYDDVLNAALAATGETKEYFARRRLDWLAGRLRRLGCQIHRVLDYGCGTGASIPLFFDYFCCDAVVGVDVSEQSLDRARRADNSAGRVQYLLLDDHQPNSDVDLAFCNGVFHHILRAERRGALHHVFRSLRPGGWFAFWENNPWNPGTRHCMRANPFDRHAIAISPAEAKRLLRAAGFEVAETSYAFFFPRLLRYLRFLDRRLSWLPLGGQYLVLARKPPRDAHSRLRTNQSHHAHAPKAGCGLRTRRVGGGLRA